MIIRERLMDPNANLTDSEIRLGKGEQVKVSKHHFQTEFTDSEIKLGEQVKVNEHHFIFDICHASEYHAVLCPHNCIIEKLF